ncbi:MAG TPA: hypothetical protein VIJ14_03000, partial [Rhabdochlamydiaceae bacterium]
MSFRNLMHAIWLSLLLAVNVCEATTLYKEYTKHCKERSDIHEHLHVLRELSGECASVIEIGVRNVVATWAILTGIADNPHHPKSYLGIDLNYPPEK